MATYAIKADSAPYVTLVVSFGDHVFEQTIITDKKGAQRDAFLQAYANEYEQAFIAALPAPEVAADAPQADDPPGDDGQ